MIVVAAVLPMYLPHCRQWGTASSTEAYGSYGGVARVAFPIAFSTKQRKIVGTHLGTDAVIVYELFQEASATSATLCLRKYDGTYSTGWAVQWVAVGS